MQAMQQKIDDLMQVIAATKKEMKDAVEVITSQKEIIAQQKQAHDKLMEVAKKIEVERDCIVSLIKTVVEHGFQKK
jgi:SpoU rRNA methylase family enzyme